VIQPNKTWGETFSFLGGYRKAWWVDLALLLGGAGVIFALREMAGEWTAPHRDAIVIDLSVASLPKYTLYSLSRGLLAYGLSLIFTLAYGYWAARDRVAEKVLVPLLDILQSVPVLGFLPGLVLALAYLFPSNNIGLEIAAILMIFTGQVWNMTFSFYHSLRSIPQDLREAATVYRFNWWQRALKVELPFAGIGLIWNSMMSMAGGWFFLMICEGFVLGDKDFRLPGLGSYMSVAMEKGDWTAMLWGILAMISVIVLLDQMLWRPLVVWGQKFRVEEGGDDIPARSWFLDLIHRSRFLKMVGRLFKRRPKEEPLPSAPRPVETPLTRSHHGAKVFSLAAFTFLLALMGLGAWKLMVLFSGVTVLEWGMLWAKSLATLARVLCAAFLGALWAVPVGLWIGLSPRRSRLLQPLIQVVASFPAPMIYPVIIFLLREMGVPLQVGSVLLMLIGVQWYILFNVVAGASAIPSDLKEAARVYRIEGWQKFRKILLPGIFPYLVTGLVTATGGAWNASIVAEFVTFKGESMAAWGLGSQISSAAAAANFPLLAAGVTVMSLVVVTFNRLVWDRLCRLAEDKYSLSK
jgi:NitT/TauT family transport system permease protein